MFLLLSLYLKVKKTNRTTNTKTKHVRAKGITKNNIAFFPAHILKIIILLIITHNVQITINQKCACLRHHFIE